MTLSKSMDLQYKLIIKTPNLLISRVAQCITFALSIDSVYRERLLNPHLALLLVSEAPALHWIALKKSTLHWVTLSLPHESLPTTHFFYRAPSFLPLSASQR